MEEKYPIKFSLGQFILLLSVEVVVLALVFLLGARFGGTIFPVYHSEQVAANRPYQSLEPKAKTSGEAPPKAPGKLTDVQEGAEAPQAAAGDGENTGEANTNEDEAAAAPDPDGADAPPKSEKIQVNKSLLNNPADKNTMVRFKSSGNSKFAVEVGKYFDELIASKQINQLKAKGIDAYLVIVNDQGSSPEFGVRIGSFGDRKSAEDFSVKMSNEKGLELRVVQVD